MLDDILDYVEHIRERPVWQSIPGHVRAHFDTPLPASPTELASVHDEFMRYILPFATGNTHPGFMGWVHGGGNVPGMLAEMLAAGLNANCGGRDHVPIEVERQIVQWMRQLFGFPETASGLFVNGTSMANLLGVLIARTSALGVGVRRYGITSAQPRLTAYASTATHGCVARAMDISGLGTESLRIVPTNRQHQIDLDALEFAIAADRHAGFTPFLIIGTVGTVDLGAIDDIVGLARIAARERLWLHVDGAFGALAILAPDIAPRLAGIELAEFARIRFSQMGTGTLRRRLHSRAGWHNPSRRFCFASGLSPARISWIGGRIAMALRPWSRSIARLSCAENLVYFKGSWDRCNWCRHIADVPTGAQSGKKNRRDAEA